MLLSKNLVLILSSLLLLLQASSVQAKNDKEEERSSDSKGKHDFKIVNKGKSVSIVSRSRDNSTKGELFARASFNGVPSFRVTYRKKSLEAVSEFKDDDGKVKSEDEGRDRSTAVFSYRVSLLGLREISKDNVLNITQKQGFSFIGTAKHWEDWVVTRNTTTDLITFSAKMNAPSGMTAALKMELTGIRKIIETRVFDPNALKFSVEFGNFDYKLQDSSIAMVFGVFAKDNGQVSNSSFTFNGGSLTWDDWVMADGVKTNVSIHTVSRAKVETSSDDDEADGNESSSLVVFKIQAKQPKYVVWDPEMSVSSSLESAIETPKIGSSATRHETFNMMSLFLAIIVSMLVVAF